MKPPLKVKDCAHAIGVSPDYLHKAIVDGISVHGQVVKLAAEKLPSVKRAAYRIYPHQFGAFLQAIEWSCIPPDFLPSAAPPPTS